MKWENKGHEFDDIAEIILESNVKYYIWGAAVAGKSFYQDFKKELDIIGYIDSDVNKQGTLIKGLPVYSPDVLKKKESHIKILVATFWSDQVFDFLHTYDYVYRRDFFLKDEFISIYMQKKHNQLILTNLSYTITRRCTLRCKYCVAFIPYYKNPQDEAIEDVLSSLENYFRYVNHLSLLSLTGGDTFLYGKLDELIETIGEKYLGSKITTLSILTNAILMPQETTLALLKKYKVIVRFTEYTKAIHKQKIPEFCEILRKNGIQYEHATFEKWADIGFPQESNGIEKEDDKIALFTNCKKSCIHLSKNQITYCGIAFRADELDYAPLDPDDTIDLTNFPLEKKSELLEFLLGYHNKGYLNLCKKCNGGLNANEFHVEVGEQL